MLFSSNRGRMQRTARAARKARCRPDRRLAGGCKPAVECLEERNLPSLFGPPTNYGAGTFTVGIAVGDINGDGVPDIVASNDNSNNVSVLLGHGDGTFGAHKDYAAGSVTTAVALGDVNGDGRLDIVADNDFGESVSVFLNNGNGTFARTDYHPGIGLTTTVALGDLNGDGHLDIVVGDYSHSKVVVLLNNGDGTFTSKTPFSVPGSNTGDVALGDLNNDGKLDLAVTYHNSAVVSVLFGNGDGTFGTAKNYTRGSAQVGLGLALGDLNGDGHLDIAAVNLIGDSTDSVNTVSVLLNNGDGTFAPKTEYATGKFPFNVALGDVDGDGHLDIVVANTHSDSVSVLLNHGDGTFGPKTDFPAGPEPIKLAVADVNGDGKLDVVTTNGGANTVSVLLNTSSTTLPSLSIADTSVKENPLGTTYASFDVTISAASDQTVTVHYDTAPGTAKPGIDYVGRHGTLTFLPGQTTLHVRVHILNDQPTGSNDQFFVNLNNAVNATIADGQAVGTILESGSSAPAPGSSPSAPAPSQSSSDRSALANDQDALVASVVASRSSPSSQVAMMPSGTVTPVVGTVGQRGTVTYLTAQTTPLWEDTHAVLTDRHAVDTLFATEDGETGL
jgi:hypothetical protein